MAMDVVTVLRLAGNALGVVGAVLVAFEFFRQPSYVDYDTDLGTYSLNIAPEQVIEHTWVGRGGALLIAVAFALQFFATLLA
jgi:hypothetical protein